MRVLGNRIDGWLWAIVLLAIVLRVWNLSAQSLDIDEFSELQLTKLTYTEAAFAADSMPPLFPVLHKALRTIWPSDMTGRWLAVSFGVAAVWVVGSRWAKAFGRLLALATAAMIAISPLHIYYSQCIRSYGPVMFWAVLTIGAIAAAVQSNRKSDWCLFAISALGGLYTHYYFAIFLAVLSLAFAVHAYGWLWSREWWIANICTAVLALPLIGFVGEDLHFQKGLRESRPMDISALGYTYTSMLTGYSVGPSKRDLQMLDRREALALATPVAIVVGFIFLSLGVPGLWYLRKRKLLDVFLTLSIAPVFLVGVLGYFANVTYNPRFVVWSLPPLLAILAAGLLEGHRRWSVRIGLAALLLLTAVAIYNRQFVPKHRNEDMRSLGEYLAQTPNAERPVFVLSNYMTPGVAHYLPDQWQVFELPKVDDGEKKRSTQSLESLAIKAFGESLPSGGDYWLAYTREFHGDPDGKILGLLTEEQSLEKQAEFAGILLYRGNYEPK